MQIDKSQVRRILVITLSNVGDIILTTPAIRTLAREFPDARMDVMVSPNGRGIFSQDPRIFKLIVYDKHLPIAEKRRLQLKLKKLSYDLVVDFKNTLFPILLGPKYRTATIQRFPKKLAHKIDRHLYRLKSLGICASDRRSYIYISPKDEERATGFMKNNNIREPMIVVNPGAKSHLKRWASEGFAKVSDRLMAECGAGIVFIGLKEDSDVVRDVMKRMNAKPHNLVDKTSIGELAGLLKRAKLLITNDSAPLHLGCAVGARVLALFGPTDPKKYGPTGEFDCVIREKLSCSPCESAACKYNYECMKSISEEAVFDTARMMIEGYE
ncbi:MAG: glycosyltransferase family 9 protein [Candidatus Omnitrophota bacterium]|nr:glycosyltransferase family 9 protein [Candidatus Omnitrophota bacterium]